MGPSRRSTLKRKAAAAATTSTLPLSQPQLSDWWLHFSNKFHGSLSDSQSFESMFKMSMKTFDYICSLVKEEMLANSSKFIDLDGNRLGLYDMVAIVLTRLGSGESQISVGSSLNLTKTVVAQLTKRFVDALKEKGLHHIYWPSTEHELDALKHQFEKIGGLPNCCGAIDTTHILMSLVTADQSTNVWCDREKNQTMTLQAIVGPDLRFRDINAGWPGRYSDEYILKESKFFEICNKCERLNGRLKKLSEGNEIKEYIVGNAGLPLLTWLLTPYRGNELRDSEVKFNERLLKTQKVAKEAFVKLKENWKIIKGVLWRPNKDRLPLIILACCILHNILIDMKDEVQEKLVFSGCLDLDYRPVVCKSDGDHNGLILRDKISVYLSGKSMP
ncbi:ALP1-like protein [Tanacetum coccineum]|uniref:ALP1-like protein n=1 Tax=Tanacetum coccineum TaxID=301880 RepID=A0ABQ5FR00_9ASTR